MNEETVILASFFVMIGYLGTVVRAPYKDWADSTIEVSLSVRLRSSTSNAQGTGKIVDISALLHQEAHLASSYLHALSLACV